jgi:5'-3' exoribonuclease 1
MGVPKFYKFLSERYPLINEKLSDTSLMPLVDNLYLDMNGIIHRCTHPNDADVTSHTLTRKDMITGIFKYIDNIVHTVRPQGLLYLAIDGVAPRAKMNQQRSRRFRR